MDQPVVIGMDVSKAELVIAVHPTGRRGRARRRRRPWTGWSRGSATYQPQLMVMEATAGYELPLAAACAAASAARRDRESAPGPGLCAGASGGRRRRMSIDAAVLALFGARVQPAPRAVAGCGDPGLGRLGHPPAAIARDARRRAPAAGAGAADGPDHAGLAQLTFGGSSAASATSTTRSARPIQHSAVWRVQEDLLRTVPGIGPTTARTLLAELPELGRLDRRAHRRAWSGSRRSTATVGSPRAGGTSGAAAPRCARASTWPRSSPAGTTRCWPPSIAASAQLGKPAKVALVAVMRKLLTILNAMMKHQARWNPKVASTPASPSRPARAATVVA